MKSGLVLVVVLLTCAYGFAQENMLTQAHLGETAYLVRKKETLLSLRQVSYGVLPYLAIETSPLYDMLGSWNLFAKVRLLKLDPVQVAGRLGIFYITVEQLPELEHEKFYRTVWGGVISVRATDEFFYHLNVSNTSLHGNIVEGSNKLFSKLTNLENDIEYKVNDRQSLLIGAGYDFSSRKFRLGASHLWGWSSLFLKLGLTFNTKMSSGMTVLPFFDLGIRL